MALLITILCPLSISRGFIKTLRHSLMAKALNALKEPLLFLMIHKVMIFWLKNCQPLSYIKSRGVYDISLTKAIYSCSIRHQLIFRHITIMTLFKQSFEVNSSLAIILMPFNLRKLRFIMKVGSYSRALRQKHRKKQSSQKNVAFFGKSLVPALPTSSQGEIESSSIKNKLMHLHESFQGTNPQGFL